MFDALLPPCRNRQVVRQRKLHSRLDKHFSTSPVSKSSRYRGKCPQPCRVPRSIPVLSCKSDHHARRAGMSLQQDRPLLHPSPSRSAELCSRLLQYFFHGFRTVNMFLNRETDRFKGESTRPTAKTGIKTNRTPLAIMLRARNEGHWLFCSSDTD
jgi:hypothetical protein